MEAVLGEETEKLGRELLSRELTVEEEESVIPRPSRLSGLGSSRCVNSRSPATPCLLTATSFPPRVGRQRDMGRFITPQDLEIYVKDYLARNFQGCRELWHEPHIGCFAIDLTMEASRSLRDFIDRGKYPSHPGIIDRKVWGTFDAEVAKLKLRGVMVPLHNHLSPLIRWITSQNEITPGGAYPLAAFTWKTQMLPSGQYAYRIERWALAGLRKQEHLCFGLAELASGKIRPALESEMLLGIALQEAERWDFPEVQTQLWRDSQASLKRQFIEWFDQACHDFTARNDGLLQIQIAQVNRQYDRRRSIDQQRLATMREKGRREAMLRLVQSNMEKDDERRRHRIDEIQDRATFIPEVSDLGAGIIKVEAA